jgi:hypothetical protein
MYYNRDQSEDDSLMGRKTSGAIKYREFNVTEGTSSLYGKAKITFLAQS